MELKAFWEEEEPCPLPDGAPYVAHGGQMFALTGVGIPQTYARLLPLIQSARPARILNIGIAGAYPGSRLAIGDVVLGTSEVFGDAGFELPEAPYFQSLMDSPFAGDFYRVPIPLTVDERFCVGSLLPQTGRGCTVNACTGTRETGLLRERLFHAAFETMEGAAVAQIGDIWRIPVCEVRAISNSASTRDMRPENIRLALSHLRDYLQACRKRSEEA